MVHDALWWPLLLSTGAGLSTTIGAVLAILRTPDESMLAFLLGTAIGVMATVSAAELWWHKAVQLGNWPGITLAVAAGAAAFALLDPLLPKPHEAQQRLPLDAGKQEPDAVLQLSIGDAEGKFATAVKRPGFAHRLQAGQAPSSGRASCVGSPMHSPSLQRSRSNSSQALVTADSDALPLLPPRVISSTGRESPAAAGLAALAGAADPEGLSVGLPDSLAVLRAHHAGLMRLGLLMAITMTLHNLPEGCAVAFSAFTDFGPLMALAIAVHNIPEGLIIAVPIYAATNSKAQAIGLAAASGLSEPLGALLALFVLRPFVTSTERLDYVLASVGGVMLAVCGMELWPEARKCRQDLRMMQGILLGSAVMAWTLYVGV